MHCLEKRNTRSGTNLAVQQDAATPAEHHLRKGAHGAAPNRRRQLTRHDVAHKMTREIRHLALQQGTRQQQQQQDEKNRTLGARGHELGSPMKEGAMRIVTPVLLFEGTAATALRVPLVMFSFHTFILHTASTGQRRRRREREKKGKPSSTAKFR